MYTSENLKELAKYLKERYRELKKDKENTEDPQPLMDLARQLDAIYYNELVFEDILKEYDVGYQLLYAMPQFLLNCRPGQNRRRRGGKRGKNNDRARNGRIEGSYFRHS